MLAQERDDERYHHRRSRCDNQNARPPTLALDERGEHRQKDELTRRRAGGEDSHGEAASFYEPSVDDRRAEDERGHPASGADDSAPEEHELPRMPDECRE